LLNIAENVYFSKSQHLLVSESISVPDRRMRWVAALARDGVTSTGRGTARQRVNQTRNRLIGHEQDKQL